MKPDVQNGGQRLQFKASMQKVAFANIPYLVLNYEFVRSREGIQGYQYGTGTATGTGTVLVPVLVWYHVNVNSTSAPHLQM